MSHLWLDERHMAIRKYSASSSSAEKSIVRLEIEVTDPHALGYLLEQIGTAQRELADARKARSDAQKSAKNGKPTLALTYRGDEP